MTASTAELGSGLTPTGHLLRRALADDLPACAAIWRGAMNDYLGRLGQPEIPDELGSLLRLYRHLLATDPGLFLVAERPDGSVRSAARSAGSGAESTGSAAKASRGASPGAAGIDGFVAALRRDELWYLSMLFVRPTLQARGLGRALLAAVLPDQATFSGKRATLADSVQPISTGLYASLGIAPRSPLLRVVGLPERVGAFPSLPAGVEAIPFGEIRGEGGLERAALSAELAALDLDAAGFSRAPDHAFAELEGRVGFLFRDGHGVAVGYGYTSEAGRVGPIAVLDAALLGAVVGFLLGAVRPRGAFGIWVPGAADGALVPLLAAGFRLEGFPALLCWDRPFADFARYIPMSPGLL